MSAKMAANGIRTQARTNHEMASMSRNPSTRGKSFTHQLSWVQRLLSFIMSWVQRLWPRRR